MVSNSNWGCNYLPLIFFGDDLVLLCRALEEEAPCLLVVLEDYAAASGQSINFEKSSLFFDHRCPHRLRRKVVELLHIQGMDGFGKYLGIEADFGASKKQIFESVRRSISTRLHGWAEQFLSTCRKRGAN